MSGYVFFEVIKPSLAAIGASATDSVISKEFNITPADSLNFTARIKCSSVTAATGITIKLQESANGGTTWEDVGNRAQVSVSGNGWVEIAIVNTDSSDAAQLPLLNRLRLTITTGAGDAATIDSVLVSRRSP